MKIEEFASWARRGGEPLRVDGISIATTNGIFNGRGTLKVAGEELLLKVTLNDSQLPDLESGRYYTREEFWSISGRIEDRLPFQAAGLSAERSTHHGHFTVQEASFHLSHLSFVTDQSRAMEDTTAAFFATNRESEETSDFWGRAFLEGHKPLWTNEKSVTKTCNGYLGDCLVEHKSDTYKGEFEDFEFAMIRVEKDTEVYLRTKKGSSVDEGEFRATFEAYRKAIAFTHGREAWPQHITIKRGFRTVQDDIYPPRKLAKTPWCLLSERTCANGSDLGLALVAATKFFLRADDLSKLVLRSLYLCRQSSLRVAPLDVGTLSLCAVLEGLVMSLHRQLLVSDATGEAIAFENAKDWLIRMARRCESRKLPGFKRLVGILSSARPYRMKEAFERLADHLDLPWEPEMKDALAAWSAERNALAHGGAPEEGSCDRMAKQSRLAGAVNLIVARLIGYYGLAVFSAIEERFVRLAPRVG